MAGAVSIVGGSSILDSGHTCPCLCLDVLPSSTMNLMKGGGEVRSSHGKKQQLSRLASPSLSSLELGSSFLDSGRAALRVVNKSSIRKQRKARSLVIVNELGGQYEDTFGDVKTQILNYFTYKAVRTVLNQLYEMNPPQYRWLYDFVTSHNPVNGKHFLRSLAKEQQGLAELIMTTRLHLYGKWIKKCDHAEIYKEISDENLELMRERLLETVIWPSDDTNTEKIC